MEEKLTEEEIAEILSETDSQWTGDNAMQGLLILSKYAKLDTLCAAEHDRIYSIDISEAIDGGITKEEIIALGKLNWMEDCGAFSCFV